MAFDAVMQTGICSSSSSSYHASDDKRKQAKRLQQHCGAGSNDCEEGRNA